jgi:hypothetical protein
MLNTDRFRHTFGDLPAWDDALQSCMQLRLGLIA